MLEPSSSDPIEKSENTKMFWVHLKLPKQARSIKDLGLIQLQVSINQTSLANKEAAEFK